MITSIEIDGFKSLRNFKMNFNKGLNVLAGPNGSGKSSILQALDLLSHIMNKNIDDAFEAIDGLEEPFSINEHGIPGSTMSFKINGVIDRKVGYDILSGHYSFYFEIKSGDSGNYFNRQDLYISGMAYPLERNIESIGDLNVSLGLTESNSFWTVEGIKREIVYPPYELVSLDEVKPESIKYNSYNAGKQVIFNVLNLSSAALGKLAYAISLECSELSIYSFVPREISKECKVNSLPLMKPSGHRLKKLIYLLETGDKQLWIPDPSEIYGGMRRVEKNDIVDYLNLVSGFCFDFDVPLLERGKDIEINVLLKDCFKDVVINKMPFESLSEGTLVWMALVFSLFYHNSGCCYDEPERYLHPDMLAHMVSLFRQFHGGWMLITTHNETVLNQLEVEELFIVEIIQGSTRVRPVENMDKFKESQFNEGRGLGYYYVAGAL